MGLSYPIFRRPNYAQIGGTLLKCKLRHGIVGCAAPVRALQRIHSWIVCPAGLPSDIKRAVRIDREGASFVIGSATEIRRIEDLREITGELDGDDILDAFEGRLEGVRGHGEVVRDGSSREIHVSSRVDA